VRRLEEPLCRRCGRELQYAGISCGCRAHLRNLSRLRSVAAYEGPLERAIHRFKYAGWRALAPELADLLAATFGRDSSASAGTLVLPVPLHPRRLRQRGYNQSELLERELRRRLQLSAPAGRLMRVRDTPPQVGLDRAICPAWRIPLAKAAPTVNSGRAEACHFVLNLERSTRYRPTAAQQSNRRA